VADAHIVKVRALRSIAAPGRIDQWVRWGLYCWKKILGISQHCRRVAIPRDTSHPGFESTSENRYYYRYYSRQFGLIRGIPD